MRFSLPPKPHSRQCLHNAFNLQTKQLHKAFNRQCLHNAFNRQCLHESLQAAMTAQCLQPAMETAADPLAPPSSVSR
jgi:hypothetical protein